MPRARARACTRSPLDPASASSPPPVVDQPAAEVDVRATGVGPEVRLAREFETALELRLPGRIAGDQLGGADVVEGVDEPLEVIDLLGDRDRLRAQADRLREVVVEHRHAGDGAVRAGELGTGRSLLEHAHRIADGVEPPHGRARCSPAAAPVAAARGPPARRRRGGGGLRSPHRSRRPPLSACRTDRRARRTARAAQRAPAGSMPLGEPQRPPVVVLRLARRAALRRPLARRRRVAEHGRPVARRLCVMGEPDVIGRAERRIGERGERPAVQRDRPVGRKRRLDGQPGELVTEEDAVGLGAQHPGAQALIERLERAVGQRLEQPHLGALRHDRDGVQEARAPTGLSRATRAWTASRTVSGTIARSPRRASR